jgi:hypothetical protein
MEGWLSCLVLKKGPLLGLENKEINNEYGRSTRIKHMPEEFVSSWIGMGIMRHHMKKIIREWTRCCVIGLFKGLFLVKRLMESLYPLLRFWKIEVQKYALILHLIRVVTPTFTKFLVKCLGNF